VRAASVAHGVEVARGQGGHGRGVRVLREYRPCIRGGRTTDVGGLQISLATSRATLALNSPNSRAFDAPSKATSMYVYRN